MLKLKFWILTFLCPIEFNGTECCDCNKTTYIKDYFETKTDLETKLTTSNYNSLYGLSGWYWSSSQFYTNYAWCATFTSGLMDYNLVYSGYYVRLGATF